MAIDLAPYFHVLTPGDHFSPRTGSAVPTVVDGLSRWSGPSSARSMVVVARGTYSDRYSSAGVIEYNSVNRHVPLGRYLDPVLGRIGLPRMDARRTWSAAVCDQLKWPPSVIFAHNGPQLVPKIDVARHRAVLYAHNDLFQTYSRNEASRTVGTALFVACVSSFLADRTASALPAGFSDRICVVPNGVDCEGFYPRLDQRRSGRLKVLFIGRTVWQKGPDVLLAAAVLLKRDDIDIHIVGSDGFDPTAPLSSYEQRLRSIARPIEDSVQFTPTIPRDQVPDLLRRADVLVVPSNWPEPFGLTVLEGMASGLPVIASTVGGLPAAMGQVGVKVPANDPASLAHALESFAEDEQLRQCMGVECRLHAEAHDWRWSRGLLDDLVADFS